MTSTVCGCQHFLPEVLCETFCTKHQNVHLHTVFKQPQTRILCSLFFIFITLYSENVFIDTQTSPLIFFSCQFSCASPSHSCPDSGCEVWVCNSDGYVGQVRENNMKKRLQASLPLRSASDTVGLDAVTILFLQVCLLNIKDEPMVEACIAVCSARIICIAAVPGLKARSEHKHSSVFSALCLSGLSTLLCL